MNKTKHFFTWLGVVLLFFVFPLAGTVFFWFDAQQKIRVRALNYAQETALPLLRTWNADAIFDQFSIEGRSNFSREKVEGWKSKLGGLTVPGIPVATRSYAGERDDNVWQFTHIQSDSTFEKGRAKVTLLIVHKTTSQAWQIENLELVPE